MISPRTLLQETGFSQYTAMVRFTYDRENTSLGAEKLAEMVRAIPGSTRVTTVSLDKDRGIAIFNVKLISAKTPKAAFVAFKENALKRFKGLLLAVEIGAGTIETKGNFILNEEKKPQTHLGDYLGQLLEEGLLLEVSIEELHRQWVDSEKMDQATFDAIIQACNNKSNFATWLCKKVATGLINQEDFQLWSAVFEFFERYKQRFEKKDINQVKTAEDINAFLTDYNRVHDEVEAKKSSGMTQKAKDETDQCLLGHLKTSDGQQWLVYKTKPGQWDLERKIGSGTSWCTVAQKHYFDMYMNQYQDPAYYIFINAKDPKEKYQIHYGSNQCKDRYDMEVDYTEDFIQEFYEYLKRVDNREYSRNAQQAQERREALNRVADSVDQMNLEDALKDKEHIDIDGYSLYGNISTELIAALVKKCGNVDTKKAVKLVARRYDNRGYTPHRTLTIVKNGFFDIINPGWRDQLYGTKDNGEADASLSKASSENRNVYIKAAQLLGAELSDEFQVRTNPDLPSLENYKTKSSGDRVLYTIPEEDRRNSIKTGKAMLEAGFGVGYAANLSYSSGPFYIYNGPGTAGNRLAYITFNSRGNDLRWGYLVDSTEPQNLDELVKVIDFIGIDLDPIVDTNRIKVWKKVGGSKGYKEHIKKQVKSVDWLPEGYLFGESVEGTISANRTQRAVPYLVTKDLSKGLYAFGNLYYTNNFIGDGQIISQGDFRTCGIPLDVIAAFCQHTNTEYPNALEKLLGRARDVTTVNVLKTLRTQGDQRHRVSLPIKKYTYRNGHEEVTTYTMNGLYGTWDQLGPAIKGSSEQYYRQIVQAINNHPGCRVDVLLGYNQDNPRHTWNGLVRIIDQDNKVVWTGKRYGNQMASWSFQDVAIQNQPDAGNNTPNYTPPQPEEPRQRRQRGQAAPAVPAEAPAQQLNALQEKRINCQYADEAYRIPANELAQGLQSAGFVTLSDHVQNRQAVIYKAVAHRGQTQYVALIYGGNGHTLVAGYPQDHSLEAVEANSTVWRRLTQELDNSVHTFMQCHNVCQELHIPMPQAIQGWLIYRQGGQH